MSEFTDRTLSRYLDQQPGMRHALLHDPAQHMQVEVLRRTLDMVERALADEGVPDDVQRRVVNRVVWGEPEGYVDVHAQMDRQRLAMAENVRPSAETPAALLADGAGPVRPDEKQT